MAKTKTYPLYLLKKSVKKFEDIFSETAMDKIKSGNVYIEDTSNLGDKAKIFIFENSLMPAPWLSDVKSVFSRLPDVKNKSSCCIVVFKHQGRMFATPFAHGWQYIDDAKVEADFGLRVAINSLDESKLKRIERSHLGEAMKGVSQSAFQRDLQAFGIDEALDLVRRIAGRTDKDEFAQSLSGSTSLKVTREMTFSEIADVAGEALSRHESDDYKKTAFQIIDKVRPILDRAMVATLTDEAVKVIKDGRDNFELSMPGWSEDDVVYYGMYGPGLKGRHPDLLMSHYREALGKKKKNLDAQTITSKHGVFAEFNNAAPSKRWSIRDSLIGSVVVGSGLYAISEGKWYRLDQQFKNDVDTSFQSLVGTWTSTPLKIKKMISTDSKKTGFESELSYNQRCSAAYGQLCLDQEILLVPSVPYGKFEACDLLDIENKKLIHVKKSSRQSSVLSHFFKQGSNSARLLKTFPEAREVLVKKVEKLTNKTAAEKLKRALGDSLDGWTVEFHIVDAPRTDGSFTIPFFSRITLRDEVRLLKGMTFDVTLKFIPT